MRRNASTHKLLSDSEFDENIIQEMFNLATVIIDDRQYSQTG